MRGSRSNCGGGGGRQAGVCDVRLHHMRQDLVSGQEMKQKHPRTRAYRRHQQQRMRHHAEFVFRNIWGLKDEEEIKDKAAAMADHLAVCSCYGCSNRSRKYEGPPIRELRRIPLDDTHRAVPGHKDNIPRRRYVSRQRYKSFSEYWQVMSLMSDLTRRASMLPVWDRDSGVIWFNDRKTREQRSPEFSDDMNALRWLHFEVTGTALTDLKEAYKRNGNRLFLRH